MHGLGRVVMDVIVPLLNVNHLLRVLADGRHGGDRVDGEVAVGGFATQHHAVSAVQDGVGHVRHFGACRARVLDHALQHLSRRHHHLACQVALGDHHLLRKRHLLRRDLHAQVTTRHHDAVRERQDLVKVAQALGVLDLADDADVLAAVLIEDLANEAHIPRALHEAGRYVVHLMLAGKVDEVVDVLVGQDGQVHLHTRQVAVLALAQLGGVVHAALAHGAVDHGDDLNADAAVRQQDDVARLHAAAQLAVAQPDARLLSGLVALKLGVAVAHRLDNDGLAGLERDGLMVLEHGGADLGALGVQQGAPLRGGRQPKLGLLLLALGGRHLAEAVQHLLVGLMGAVAKIQADDVHAGVQELAHCLLVPALGAHGANDVGRARHVQRLGDEVQAGVGGAAAGDLALVDHGGTGGVHHGGGPAGDGGGPGADDAHKRLLGLRVHAHKHGAQAPGQRHAVAQLAQVADALADQRRRALIQRHLDGQLPIPRARMAQHLNVGRRHKYRARRAILGDQV
mmetsp:Transcript_510/g.1397  ORF Transcript_510/g.1397 Transcript_510/m.1397 type:complete len:512 (+) Transcript_510:699-2234(+)